MRLADLCGVARLDSSKFPAHAVKIGQDDPFCLSSRPVQNIATSQPESSQIPYITHIEYSDNLDYGAEVLRGRLSFPSLGSGEQLVHHPPHTLSTFYTYLFSLSTFL